MLRINQEEEAFEPTHLTNNARQEDENSLLEEAETIYKKLDDESVMISRTPEQFSKKYTFFVQIIFIVLLCDCL
jgi:hypothetical protein